MPGEGGPPIPSAMTYGAVTNGTTSRSGGRRYVNTDAMPGWSVGMAPKATVVSPRLSPVRTKYEAEQWACPMLWWAELTRVTWCICRDSRGRCSDTSIPGTDVAIG